MRIAAYTVALNEEQFVDRWCESAKDADLLVVGDTGSSDSTVELLRESGVTVHDISVRPWRFDHARNALLFMLPSDVDVCISLDMDEILEPGWRQELERKWVDGTTRAWYDYRWSPDVSFLQNKVHARHGYSWRYPCHEHLHSQGDEAMVECPDMKIVHLPDMMKPRSSYLHLLEVGTREDRQNDRMSYYLGREYFFHGRWEECRSELDRYLGLAGARWDEERAQALMYMAKCRQLTGDPHGSEVYMFKAMVECPSRRETWLEMAEVYSSWGMDRDRRWAASRGLAITERKNSFLSSSRAWDGTLERLADLG